MIDFFISTVLFAISAAAGTAESVFAIVDAAHAFPGSV